VLRQSTHVRDARWEFLAMATLDHPFSETPSDKLVRPTRAELLAILRLHHGKELEPGSWETLPFLMTIEAMCERFSLSRSMVNKLMNAGHIESTKIMGRRLVVTQSLVAYIRAHTTKGN